MCLTPQLVEEVTSPNVSIDGILRYGKRDCEVSEFAILQNIFWLAQELKIHFRINKQRFDPYNIIVENKTEKCRINGLAILGDMIEKMKNHLEAHKAGPDLRNKYLYSLRRISKNIRQAKDIESINRLKSDAEDEFDLYWEEVEHNP